MPCSTKKFSEALRTTDRAKKTELYDAAQKAVWDEMPWLPLVAEKNVSAKVKRLTGFYVRLDAGFD